MDSRNPDRLPISIRRQRCESVAQMQRDRWEVISCCEKCGLNMVVDLALVARVSGPDTSLWNRKARCRQIGCAGWVEFKAKAPGMNMYEPLSAPDPRLWRIAMGGEAA
jgi:hypothetical protein